MVMALLDPHPALKVAAPESPMIDGWIGDDWFQNGAYRQINWAISPARWARAARARRSRAPPATTAPATCAGSVGDFARANGLEQIRHGTRSAGIRPTTLAFWQQQALDKLLAKLPAITVPTMWEQGLWDQGTCTARTRRGAR